MFPDASTSVRAVRLLTAIAGRVWVNVLAPPPGRGGVPAFLPPEGKRSSFLSFSPGKLKRSVSGLWAEPGENLPQMESGGSDCWLPRLPGHTLSVEGANFSSLSCREIKRRDFKGFF